MSNGMAPSRLGPRRRFERRADPGEGELTGGCPLRQKGMLHAWYAAVRSLAHRRGLASMVAFTLALGIGANSAIFSAVDAVLLRPLPYPAADRLVAVYERNSGLRQATQLVAPGRLEEWHAQNRTFTALGASYFENLTDMSGPLPERVAAM